MIISVWKPISIKSKISHYDLVNVETLLCKKGTSGYKVIWICDNENCKAPNKLHSISACHLIKEKMSYETQICRPCQCSGSGNGRYGDHRKWEDFFGKSKVEELKTKYSNKWKGNLNPSKLSHVKIKKNQVVIDKDYIKKICNYKNFSLIEIIKLDGKNSEFIVRCQNDHESKKTYTSFTNKNKKWICSKCFYDSIGMNLTDEELKEFKKYSKQVRGLTAKNYRLYKKIINPKNLITGKSTYHVDHKYSICEGYRNNVDFRVISSKENLEIIKANENLKKNINCSISLNELLSKTKYLYSNNKQ